MGTIQSAVDSAILAGVGAEVKAEEAAEKEATEAAKAVAKEQKELLEAQTAVKPVEEPQPQVASNQPQLEDPFMMKQISSPEFKAEDAAKKSIENKIEAKRRTKNYWKQRFNKLNRKYQELESASDEILDYGAELERSML